MKARLLIAHSSRSLEASAEGHAFGINGVGEPFQFEPRQTTYVSAGRRTVWYGCPGFVSMDFGPSVGHRFKAGQTYELRCSESGLATVVLAPAP